MYDVIIIGAGVAGFSAALFAARRGLEVLVIGKDIAGQANYTDLIENYPGLEQTGGFKLVSGIRKQAEKFGIEFLEAEVSKIRVVSKMPFDTFVATAYGKQYKSQSLIVAFGKTPRDLEVPGEEELKGKGVSYCANCDAPLYKNKIVVIAGIGDIAADAAIILTKYAKKVYVLSKTDKFTAHSGLVKALFRRKNVELVPNIQILAISGEGKVSGLRLLDQKGRKQYDLKADGIFVELGYAVESSIVRGLLKLDEQEQIIVKHDQATSMPGIFAAGDCTNRPYKQAVISAGEGANAALACYDWLQNQQGAVGLSSDWTQIKRVK